MYWILAKELVDEDRDAYLSGSVDFPSLGGEVSFRRGISYKNHKIPLITLTLNEGSRTQNMTDNLSISELYGLVFSSKLRDLVHILSVQNLEYYDLKIVNNKTGETHIDYKITNIIGCVDCVDLEKSELKFFDNGDIKRIRKLVLDKSKIPPDMKIFRLSNRKILTVVHESIKNVMLSAGITGCVFYKPEDYH